MKNNKKADTIAGIIIAVFILSFILLGLVNILDYNKDILYKYDNKNDLHILKSNAENLIKKVNTSNIEENETFWLNKDSTNKELTIFTGSSNEDYKYIDKNGNKVDPNNFEGTVYTREFVKEIDLLRNNLSPDEINNIVFHFDANNINGNNNIGINNGDDVDVWEDLIGTQNAVNEANAPGNYLNLHNSYSSDSPIYSENGINGLPMVKFNGSNQMLALGQHTDINNDKDCNDDIVYNEKSFAIVFKTGIDTSGTQIIYEQGGNGIGYNFMIEDGEVYAGAHNIAKTSTYACFNDSSHEWDSLHEYKYVSLGNVLPNTTYFIMIVQDSSNTLDLENKLKIYLNGYLVDEIDHVDPTPEHYDGGLGNVFLYAVNPITKDSINDVGDYDEVYFEGGIGELISWNHALSENEIKGIQNYFNQKWLGGEDNVKYDIITTSIKEYK